MLKAWRLSFLLCLLISLMSIQQLFALWSRQSSRILDDQYWSQLHELERKAVIEERELVRSGVLWIGQLHDPESIAEEAFGNNTSPLTPQKLIGTTIGFDKEFLSTSLELHECNAGSPQCSSGGGITVSHADRVVCRISVWCLQSRKSEQKNLYRVQWELMENGPPSTDTERLEIIQLIAGEGQIPDRALFHRLIRIAYGYEQQTLPLPPETIEKQIVRTVCRAIVNSRAHQHSSPAL